MFIKLARSLVLALALPLAACGGGSGGAAPATGPGAPNTPQDFTAFVKALFDQTDDTAEPVDVNDVTLTGTDIEDETAYDDVLSANGG